ncbi:Na+/H+ antiporter subunit A [Flaviflexus salsibiostraticola]|uniref:Na+/H+ antiporter subunit A n=1 Tax=Flaviflexus salsibiostraticola TaxID=1282737 RepID=A0A3S8Z9R4_9ACTO|nr:Na+/H+ antiporter subunit A [Flaviflexus salsibiostraticola]AZN30202.1 Na+/H+ antiporter subunit A [Flaviflexus salsibiostraticola]
MIELLIAFGVVALAMPAVMKWLGREGFFVAALVPLAGFVWTVAQGPAVLEGSYPQQTLTWVPELGLAGDFRLDTLSWVMSLLVTGIGALVLIYSARYFSRTASGLGRFAAFFVAFAGAMFGLVTTDNTLIMYIMWELTTVFSFLLIGHYRDRRASRRAAMEAIIVTTAGGLAMLGGIILLGELPSGSYSFTDLVSAASAGTLLDGAPAGVGTGYVTTAVVLLLLGALSKSAIFPFHFWLPAAMAAPTPTSAYLHAAAMVKAGVYLVARLAPGFAQMDVWLWIIIPAGLFTMLLGGYRALRQNDTKLVLAYGTVSQLGFMLVLVGYGTAEVALAGLAVLTAHALFKSALFLSVGIVDWMTGTRDLRELSGIGRRRPLLAAAAGFAVLSMAGIPPFAGYVGKEAALHALTYGGTLDLVVAWTIVLGSILTLAYGLRFWWGCFWDKPGVEPTELKNRSAIIIIPPVILAAASLILGLLPSWWESLLIGHADLYPGESGHLTLWAGFGLAVVMTGSIIVGGIILFAVRKPFEKVQRRAAVPFSAEGAYRRIVVGLEHFAGDVTARVQSGSQPMYLSIILATAALAGTGALVFGDTAVDLDYRWYDTAFQVPVVIIACVSAVLAARARRRLKAVLLLSISGYSVALIYELHGAPDLALTQVLVETITLFVFVLVLRRLPAYFSNRPMATSRWFRAGLGIVVGACVGAFAFFAANARQHPPVSSYFPSEAYDFGYGKNIVNVALVDMRAWDTMGEISVVAACAIGVASLLFIRDRQGRIDPRRNIAKPDTKYRVWLRPQEDDQIRRAAEQLDAQLQERQVRVPGRNRRWLPAASTLATPRRSVIFEVGTRLIYHTMLMGSLFLLFSGHNLPGGGFAGGLLAGIALTMRYLAGGRYELGAAMPLHPGILMGSGLMVATLSGLAPIILGGTTLESAKFDLVMPIFGEVKFATAIIFDVGVYLVVVGLVLEILRSLGAEVDRHGELEGLDDDGSVVPTPKDDRRKEAVTLREAKESST